nr:unnamed protein product [Spirometra erinaceieuropaei]
MVERFHSQLKPILQPAEGPGNWSDDLPLERLDTRADLKSDLGCSAVDLVFSTTLQLPGEVVNPTLRGAHVIFVYRLRQLLCSLSPVPPRTLTTESYAEKGLDDCTHVVFRCNRVRQPLESPYEGPVHVYTGNMKTCRILRGDRKDVVSVDRVKAAVAEVPPDLPQG